MRKKISVILAASAATVLITGTDVLADRPELIKHDLTNYDRDNTYNITVSPEEQQKITNWGICTTDGDDKFWYPYSPQYQAGHSASISDSGITMFRTGMPSRASYTEDKKFDEAIMKLYIDNCIKPQVEAGLTQYLISNWWPPEWMRYTDDRGWIHLKEECEDDMVEWVIRVFDYIKDHGYPAPIAYAVQNEPADPGINNYTPEQMARVTKKLRVAFDKNGYEDVKLCVSEGASINQQFFLLGNDFSEVTKDPEYADAIGVFAHHAYLQNFDLDKLKNYMECVRRYPDKEVWETEFCYGSGEQWYCENQVMDCALITGRTFITDMAWIGCNNWMYWTDILNYYKMNENGDISAWGRLRQHFGTMALGEGDDGYVSFRKTPTYALLKLVYRNTPVGSVVHRMTTDDPSIINEPDYQTDLVAFDTPNGTTSLIMNSNNYPKHYNLHGFEGKSAAIYSIAEKTYYKTDTSYRNIQDGTISELTLPPFSINVIVSTDDDLAAPAFNMELDPMIFQKDGVYCSRNNEIDFNGSIDEDDARIYMDGKKIDINDKKFSQKIKITEHPKVTLYGIDKHGNRSDNFIVEFKNVPNYVGMKINKYQTQFNVSEFTIKGSVNTETTIHANDQVVKSNADNTFEIPLKLSEGDNKFSIYAEDTQGNKSAVEEIEVFCDTKAPDINITNKVFTTDNPQFMIKGNLSEKVDKLTVDGKEAVQRDDLSFATVTLLKEGTNTVTIECVDTFGNKSQKTVEVTYQKTDKTPHLVEGEGYAHRASGYIKLDGVLDEADWKLDMAATKITEGTQNNVVKFGMLWDNQNLYIGVKVIDDLFKIECEYPYQNDCVEIFLNPSNKKAGGFVKGDKQLFSGFVENNRSAFFKNTAGEVNSAFSFNEDGYTYEIALPWYTVGVDPSDGVNIGMDIVVDDNDLGSNIRNTCIAWWGENNDYANTSGYGTITLTSDENVTYKDIPYNYFEKSADNTKEEPVNDEPEEAGMKFMLNGEELSDALPIMNSKGIIMLPLDTLVEKTGMKMDFLLGRNVVLTLSSGKKVSFYDTWNMAQIGNNQLTLDKPPAEYINDVLYISADFAAMFMDGSVEYNDDNTVLNLKGMY